MYKYIIFDADNTILDFSFSEGEALTLTLMKEPGINFEPEIHIPLYKGINKAIWHDFENGEIDADELKVERFRRFFIEADASVPVSKLPEISDTYLKNLSKTSKFLPGAKELLEKLLGRVDMALLTNGLTRVQKPRFQQAGMNRYFPTILISDEFNIAKPDPEIFALACRRLGAERKADVLMVGDNLNSDIRGGNEFGIDTCWFNPEKRSGEGEIIPRYEMRDFKEFENIIPLP